MEYKIKPHSDDIIYTNPPNEVDFTGEKHLYLPLYEDDQYYLHYEIGLIIKAELGVGGWTITVLENPIGEENITKELKEDGRDEYLIVNTQEDLGEIEVHNEKK